MRRMLAAALAAAAAVALAGAIAAENRLPIVDAHVHYSQNDWGPYPPAKVFELFDRAGVPRVLASSTPDDGTVRLYKLDPGRVVPILRPYRAGVGSGNWFNDPALAEYLEGRLKSGIYRGIGEFHLFDAANAGTPQVRRVAELAVERDIHLHVHSGAEPIRRLFALEPRLKILWAHAGMIEPPQVVGPMLDQFKQLWTEVSFRAAAIAPGGRLDPAWRDLFLKHPDRFLVGTDTYVTARWGSYLDLIEEHRAWLAQLPRDVAEKIAYRNAVALFGAGDRAELLK
jgi:hypothetical protein